MAHVDELPPLAERFKLALDAVRNGMAMRKASRQYQVPKTSLHRRVHSTQLQRQGRPTILSEQGEQVVLEAFRSRDRAENRMTLVELKRLVREIATRRGRHLSDSFPDHKWVRRFSQRHGISMTGGQDFTGNKIVDAEAVSPNHVSSDTGVGANKHIKQSNVMDWRPELTDQSTACTTPRQVKACSSQYYPQREHGSHQHRVHTSPSHDNTDGEHTLSPTSQQSDVVLWPQLNHNRLRNAARKAQQLVGLDHSQTAALTDILSTANEDPVVLVIQPNQQWLRYHDAATVTHVLDAIATFDLPWPQRRDAATNCLWWCFRFSSIDDVQRCQDEVFARFPETFALGPRAIACGIKDVSTIPMALAALLTRIGPDQVDVSLFGFFQL